MGSLIMVEKEEFQIVCGCSEGCSGSNCEVVAAISPLEVDFRWLKGDLVI